MRPSGRIPERYRRGPKQRDASRDPWNSNVESFGLAGLATERWCVTTQASRRGLYSGAEPRGCTQSCGKITRTNSVGTDVGALRSLSRDTRVRDRILCTAVVQQTNRKRLVQGVAARRCVYFREGTNTKGVTTMLSEV